MKTIGKSRGTVWTPQYPNDPDVQFEIAPLTPSLSEQISNEFLSAKLKQGSDGKNSIETEIKSLGLTRAQAKAIVKNFKGFKDEAGNPLPATPDNVAVIFDEWDDGGLMALFVVQKANEFASLREEQLKNSATPSATS